MLLPYISKDCGMPIGHVRKEMSGDHGDARNMINGGSPISMGHRAQYLCLNAEGKVNHRAFGNLYEVSESPHEMYNLDRYFCSTFKIIRTFWDDTGILFVLWLRFKYIYLLNASSIVFKNKMSENIVLSTKSQTGRKPRCFY